MKCHAKCKNNSECGDTSSCCSEGQCTDEAVCRGNKIIGDYCDQNSECIADFCQDNRCQETLKLVPEQLVFFIIIIVISITVGACIVYYCLVHLKIGQNKSRQSSLDNRAANRIY